MTKLVIPCRDGGEVEIEPRELILEILRAIEILKGDAYETDAPAEAIAVLEAEIGRDSWKSAHVTVDGPERFSGVRFSSMLADALEEEKIAGRVSGWNVGRAGGVTYARAWVAGEVGRARQWDYAISDREAGLTRLSLNELVTCGRVRLAEAFERAVACAQCGRAVMSRGDADRRARARGEKPGGPVRCHECQTREP